LKLAARASNPRRTQANIAHSDYINPIDLCNRLNTYIIPEAVVHGFITFLFLINGYWVALVLNLPLLAWNVKKYVRVDSGSGSIYSRL
jgi:hypothetical protein